MTHDEIMDKVEFVLQYELDVAMLNCEHADEHGVCEISGEYCLLSPCPNYEEKQK